MASAGLMPSRSLSRPPTNPPKGISAHAALLINAITRPRRCSGIRSSSTAARIGLIVPAPIPPTKITGSTTQSGAPDASTRKRGPPIRKNPQPKVARRGSRCP